MLNIMVTEMDGEINASITGNNSLEEAVKDLKEAGAEEERVIAHMQFNDEEDTATTVISSLCYLNAEIEGSFCYKFEEILTAIFNAGIKHGMQTTN
jgi:hypothetical protein